MLNLYKVRAKSGDKYQTVHVFGFSFSDVESKVLLHTFPGTETLKKYKSIKSIELVAAENDDNLLGTKPVKQILNLGK